MSAESPVEERPGWVAKAKGWFELVRMIAAVALAVGAIWYAFDSRISRLEWENSERKATTADILKAMDGRLTQLDSGLNRLGEVVARLDGRLSVPGVRGER